MKKQEQLKEEVQDLICKTISELTPEKKLEAGLSYIGLELERIETEIAIIWAMYENESPAVIKYPSSYSLLTDEERVTLAQNTLKQLQSIPSNTYKKEVVVSVVKMMIAHKVTKKILDTIIAEINALDIVVIDPEDVITDFEAGILGGETAAKLRGYSSDEFANEGV